ncbi:MAG: hypothetical protein HYU38_00005, partial [Candidatus Tectomicrobia bacterium]|nr:hypothetical protein [Candidatus Tectomicrobia bacterium]
TASDRLYQVIDANLTTAAQVADRATAELRRRAVLPRQAEVGVPVNCGQQLYDVVAVTAPAMGWTAKPFRVVGLRTRYVRHQGASAYQQRLALGGV